MVVFVIISYLAIYYRYEIQVVAFYKWNIRIRCCSSKSKISGRSYKYDAFICFAEEDLNYVRDELIPLLEPKYKLCIYYRDFLVGDDIAEAIIDVIENSAVTIIILSKSFVNSRWGRFEFKQAHFNAMQTGQILVVVVVDDKVLNMKLDLVLKSILFSKAYLRKDDRFVYTKT